MRNKEKSIIFLLTVLVFVIFFIYMITSHNFVDDDKLVYIISSACLLLCSGTIYLVFSQAISSGDYTAVAGVSSKKNYNKDILNNLVDRIMLLTLYHSFAFNLVFCLLASFGFMTSMKVLIFIILYVLDLFTIMIFLNKKYKNELYN